MKNILITGANSYIGNSFKEYMNSKENEDTIDIVDTKNDKWKQVDFSKYDVVFDVAGIVHIKETKRNEDLFFKINRDLTFEIAKKAKKSGVKQFIFLSSMNVYGMTTGVITEHTLPNPKDLSGKSKLAAEELISKLEDDDFIISILRPPIVYGKGCKGNYKSLSNFVKKIPIFPKIQNNRSMLYIDNLSAFLKKIIEKPESKIFFPQNKNYVCTSNMVEMICVENNKNIKLTKIFNWAIKILSSLKIFQKVFGNLTYKKIDVVDEIDFKTSIALTEADSNEERTSFCMKNHPTVSVIIATYRRDKELILALKSLLIQTYQPLEIVLVDDNANEKWNQKVMEIVTSTIANTKIQYQYIANAPNKGSAETRNIGIHAANGEYITFLDDDDIYLPNKVQAQICHMVKTNADYCITDLLLYNENNKQVDTRIRDYLLDDSTESLLKYHLMYHMTGTDTLMFKKDYLLKIGCFPPIDIGDEFYLMSEAIRADGRFAYLNECDVKGYIHASDGGLSSGESKIKGENELYKYKKTFFHEIDKKSQRYINMRHYAVLAFAEIRRKRYFAFIKNAVASFFNSPIECVKLLKTRL